MRPPPDRLGPLDTQTVDGLARSVLAVPLGSTEQHGPHLPLDTDTRIAEAWAAGMAAAHPAILTAPALPYGSSGEHQSFTGTLSIGTEALEHLLVELIRSAAHSFQAVVLVCGHAGNATAVHHVVKQMQYEGHRVQAVFPTWDAASMGFAIDAHAGRVETSLMLHIAPATVNLERAEAGTIAPLGDLIEDLRSGGVAAVAANGVLGDPSGAGQAEGRRLLDDLVTRSLHDIAPLLTAPSPTEDQT